MWIITIVFGVLLAAQGVLGFALYHANRQTAITDAKGLTALIPSAIGLVLIVCGVLAKKDNLRKHVMHAAVLVGLIGFFGAAIKAAPAVPTLIMGGHVTHANGEDATLAVVMQLVMAALCLVFVGLCVNSFVQARLLRKAGQPRG